MEKYSVFRIRICRRHIESRVGLRLGCYDDPYSAGWACHMAWCPAQCLTGQQNKWRFPSTPSRWHSTGGTRRVQPTIQCVCVGGGGGWLYEWTHVIINPPPIQTLPVTSFETMLTNKERVGRGGGRPRRETRTEKPRTGIHPHIHRHTDRHTDRDRQTRQADRHTPTHTQTDRQAHIQRQTDKYAYTHTYSQTDRHTYRDRQTRQAHRQIRIHPHIHR